MGFYHQFQMAKAFANFISFIQIQIYKFGTIMQSSC